MVLSSHYEQSQNLSDLVILMLCSNSSSKCQAMVRQGGHQIVKTVRFVIYDVL